MNMRFSSITRYLTASLAFLGLLLGQAAWGQTTFDDALQVVTGVNHSCALTNSNLVFCWGDNAFGQLGDNTTTPRLTPVLVLQDVGGAPLTGVSAIAAGGDFTCALTTAQEIKCWGDNGRGQLGDGSVVVNSPIPVEVDLGIDAGSGDDLVALSLISGKDHACAVVRASGGGTRNMKCWGDNQFGQLGNYSFYNSTSCPDALTCFSATPVFVQVSINLTPGIGTPINLFALQTAAAGDMHTCVSTKTNGSSVPNTVCWGSNSNGQLGVSGTGTGGGSTALGGVISHAVINNYISALSGITPSMLSAGGTHSCVLASTGVKCWGNNFDGQIGDNTQGDVNNNRVTPTDVLDVSGTGNLSNVLAMTSGTNHTCAMKASAAGVFCWGRNDKGQIGAASTATCGADACNLLPTQAAGFASVNQTAIVTAPLQILVAAGGDHSCALADLTSPALDFGIHCWGDNDDGELGDNGATAPSSSTAVPVVTFLASTTVSFSSSCSPCDAGENVTLTATVTQTNGGAPIELTSSNFSFKDNATSTALTCDSLTFTPVSPAVPNVATCIMGPTNVLPVDNYTLLAVYNGQPNLLKAETTQLPLAVNAIPVTVTLSGVDNTSSATPSGTPLTLPVITGDSVTLTATLSTPNGTTAPGATGTVAFTIDGVAITGCSAVVPNVSNIATCGPFNIAQGSGSYPMLATYTPGSTNYTGNNGSLGLAVSSNTGQVNPNPNGSNPSEATVLRAFTLTVRVTNLAGQPIDGTTPSTGTTGANIAVTSVPAQSGPSATNNGVPVVTDINGIASIVLTANSHASATGVTYPIVITATNPNNGNPFTGTTTFNFTNLAGSAAVFTIISPTPDSGGVTASASASTFSPFVPLVVQVQDVSGNPVMPTANTTEGQQIFFVAPSDTSKATLTFNGTNGAMTVSALSTSGGASLASNNATVVLAPGQTGVTATANGNASSTGSSPASYAVRAITCGLTAKSAPAVTDRIFCSDSDTAPVIFNLTNSAF